jgi:MazG family protein
MSDSFAGKGEVVGRMLALCARLRGPDGCAWDREQKLATLTPYLLEEVHEVLDAVASGNHASIREELGDLLFVTLFALHASESESIATVEEIVGGTVEKLVRRHPHVFGESPGGDRDHARESWQKAKRSEGSPDGHAPSALGSLPGGGPALIGAFRLQEKAAAVGFDWPNLEGPLQKVEEELRELEADAAVPERAARELGDLLFAVANVARHLRVDPETALRGANRRFYDRFRFIERTLAADGRHPEDVDLETLETLWGHAKQSEREP